MAQQTPEQIIEGQRQDWNRVAGGWEKWDRFFDEQMAFLNHRLVADARLRAGMQVLDLGSAPAIPPCSAHKPLDHAGVLLESTLRNRCLLLRDARPRRWALRT
jgi:enediyne biosynthesis protein CalE5